MKREIYVMMDSISKNVGEPFTMTNHEEVRRAMKHFCSSPSVAVPEYTMRDTVVFHVGSLVYEGGNVCIVPDPCPTIVARGENYCEKRIPENCEEDDSPVELPSA